MATVRGVFVARRVLRFSCGRRPQTAPVPAAQNFVGSTSRIFQPALLGRNTNVLPEHQGIAAAPRGVLRIRTLTSKDKSPIPPPHRGHDDGDDSDGTGSTATDSAASSSVGNNATVGHEGQSSSLVNALPTSIQPYALLVRIDKPIGTALLMWPCFWSTAIAADAGCLPDPKLLGLFAVGSFVMRGAGCTINDMWDADFDANVERTKSRPLASQQLTKAQATSFLALQLSAGLGVLLSLPHTEYCFYVGAASLPFVATYPLMKRYTNWPQLVLGMTFNWGAFMGWAAVHGTIDWSVVGPLWLSGVCWTMVYDTIYAHQDKADDSKLGLKSTALHFGQNTKPILHIFAAGTLLNLTAAGYAVGYSAPWYYLGCGLAYSHLTWQIHTADLDEPSNLATRFRSNNTVGAIVFASCVAGNLTAALP